MRIPHTRRVVLGLGLGGALAGCGFRPIHSPVSEGGTGAELAAVYVGILPDRPGQLFRQAMQERLSNESGTAQRYELRAILAIGGEGIAIQPGNIATRIRLTGNVAWSLIAWDPARTALTSGNARIMDGFNIFNNQYFAADMENEQVQRRMVNGLADQVVTQLAIWFRAHPSTQPG